MGEAIGREEAIDAVTKDDPARVRALFARHADLKAAINEPFAAFDSPLINHVRSAAMLDTLLEAGADLNARSRWWAGGFGLLDVASPEVATHAIARGARVDVHSAARLGLLDRLKELVTDNPASVHARGGDGQTPLHFAGTIAVAEYLLSQGAAIDSRDIDHESTPAQHMVRDRPEIARYLVQQGAASDLLLASALGEVALVQRHLEADPACIHTSVSERFFPKQNPRGGGHIYQWTLGRDKTAHVVAHEFGHAEVFRILMASSPDDLQLTAACEIGDQVRVDALLANRPDMARGLTADHQRKLSHAARDNKTEVVRRMLAAGWPVDVRGQHGATALHWAAFNGNAEMVETILRHDPPLKSTDSDYQMTALEWANYGVKKGWHRQTGNYTATIEALRRVGG